jgi:hypothetical protein
LWLSAKSVVPDGFFIEKIQFCATMTT